MPIISSLYAITLMLIDALMPAYAVDYRLMMLRRLFLPSMTPLCRY